MRNSERDLEARRKAQALWDEHKKRDEKVLKEKDKERQAEAEKVARLRELRLAKEAARKWQFPPADTQDSREWLVRFEFTRRGPTGHATPRS